MNAIIRIEGGIIEQIITVKCSTQANCIYIHEARQMGIEIDEEEERETQLCDMALSNLINRVDEELLFNGKELKYFETTHVKPIK